MAVDIKRFEEAGLKDYLDIILRRWKVLLPLSGVLFVVVFIGMYYVYEKRGSFKDYYTAQATILISPERYEIQASGGQIIKDTRPSYSQVSILKSELIAARAADIMIKELGYKEPKEELLNKVESTLKVEPVQVKDKSKLVGADELNISATSVNPCLALDTVNSVIESYVRQKKEDVENFFIDTYKTLNRQLDIARKNLHKTERALVDFTIKNEDVLKAIKTYGSKEKEKGVLSGDMGINEQYVKLKSDIVATEEFIASVKNLAQTDRVLALTAIAKINPSLVDLNLKKVLLEKEEELNGLLIVNEEAHPEVVRAKAEVASIRHKIDIEISNAIKTMELELETLKLQKEKMAQLVQPEMQNKIITYGILKNDLGVRQKIYNKLAEDLQQLNIGEKLKRYTEMKVLQPANLPTKPSASARENLIQVFGLSVVASLFLSIAIISIPELLDTSIKNVEQLEQVITNMPILATIPKDRVKRDKRKV